MTNGYTGIISVVIALAAQTIGIVWWAASLNSEVKQLTVKQRVVEEQLTLTRTHLVDALERVTRVEQTQRNLMDIYLKKLNGGPR